MNKYSKLNGDQLTEHLSNYLINSWSYSAVSTFCRNEKAFEQQYIYLERDRRSVSSISGSAYHAALQSYFENFKELKKKGIDSAITEISNEAFQYLDAVPANDWKISDRVATIENALAEANKNVNSLLAHFAGELSTYVSDIKEVIDVEKKYEAWITLNGVDIPLPLHFIVDLVVTTRSGKTVIVDHKGKSKFTEPDELALAHGKQAITYVLGWEATHPGKHIDEVWFIENKISTNKDGSAQLRKHSIVMDADSRRLYESLLYESVRRLIEAVSNPDYIYTINDQDNLSDKAALYDFWARTIIAEVDDFKEIPEDKKALIQMRQRKIKDSSIAMISPKVITSFRKKAASFITFDYTHSDMTSSEKIEHLMRSFGISVKVAHEIKGYSCDTYLCQVAAGVKIANITRYRLDIANALDVSNVRIPSDLVVYEGKSYLSIEVNKHRTQNLLWDISYLKDKKIPLGLDNFSNTIVWDLENHSTPHMLVCGATGSGKSVLVRSTLDYALSAGIKDVIILDPKYEFTQYSGVAKVFNDIDSIEATMASLVNEMQRRVEAHLNTTTLVIFDEFADAAQQSRKGKALQAGEKSLMENLQMLLQKAGLPDSASLPLRSEQM